MMAKDRRYKTVKVLIETGTITEFREIFDNIPKTTVAADMGTNYKRLLRLTNDVDQFKIADLFTLARFFEVEKLTLLKLVVNQSENAAKKKRGK